MVSAEIKSSMQLLLEANATMVKEAGFRFVLFRVCIVTQIKVAEMFRVFKLMHGINSLLNAGSACAG